jgi:hypothetical protein
MDRLYLLHAALVAAHASCIYHISQPKSGCRLWAKPAMYPWLHLMHEAFVVVMQGQALQVGLMLCSSGRGDNRRAAAVSTSRGWYPAIPGGLSSTLASMITRLYDLPEQWRRHS